MLKKMILFNLAFIFAVAAEAMPQEDQEDSLFNIGDRVYVIDSDNPSPLPFIFGKAGEIVGVSVGESISDADPMTTIIAQFTNLTARFNDDTHRYEIYEEIYEEIYDSTDLYISKGCVNTIGGRVCVSTQVAIDIHLPSFMGDHLIHFGGAPSAKVLAVNESKRSIMVGFIEPVVNLYVGQNTPIVYSLDDVARNRVLSIY